MKSLKIQTLARLAEQSAPRSITLHSDQDEAENNYFNILFYSGLGILRYSEAGIFTIPFKSIASRISCGKS